MESARGTVDFIYKGKEIKLRPDIQSIEEIESYLDFAIIKMAIAASNREGFKFKEVKTVIWAGMRGFYRDQNKISKAPTIEEVGKELFKVGHTNVDLITAVTAFLINCITTPDEIKQSSKKNTEMEE